MSRANGVFFAFVFGACLTFGTSALRGQEILFEDNFDRDDGPPDDWTVLAGDWQILDGKLFVPGGTGEGFVYLGNPPEFLPEEESFELSFELDFPEWNGERGVGRHGGIMLFAVNTSPNRDNLNGAYEISYLDRDRGMRVVRWDPGPTTEIPPLDAPPRNDPPVEWKIIVAGDLITFFGDGQLMFQVADSTYRFGSLGFWNFGEDSAMTVDNFVITVEPANHEVNCNDGRDNDNDGQIDCEDSDCVESVICVGERMFCDNFEDDDQDGDTDCDDSDCENIPPCEFLGCVDEFDEDFGRPDGPPSGWTIYNGEWYLMDETLTVPPGGESHIYYGDPPDFLPDEFELSFSLDFPDCCSGGVGRHGGIIFFSERVFSRGTGYTVDFIDRDKTIRVIRWGGPGGSTSLLELQLADPPLEWNILVDPEIITVVGDGEIIAEVVDIEYRQGLLGFWNYGESGMVIDDLVLTCGPTPRESNCDDGLDGDGDGDIDCADGDCANRARCVPEASCDDGVDNDEDGGVDCDDSDCAASQPCVDCGGAGLEEDFDDTDDLPEDYTVFSGDWSIADGKLYSTAGAGEAHIWLEGLALPADFELSFDVEFPNYNGDTGVGRHGGPIIFSNAASTRSNGSYTVDWIDRGFDHGFRVFYNLDTNNAPQMSGHDPEGESEPPVNWRIIFRGDTLSVYGDGELIGELDDPIGDRAGILGFFHYGQSSDMAIDNLTLMCPCEPDGPTEASCNDGVDNDCDGVTDDADEDCQGVGPFVRGDCDGNGEVGGSPTEAIVLLNFAFRGASAPGCLAACDAEANGAIGITDALRILRFAFLGMGMPDAPFPDCTRSDLPSDVDLGCATVTACP